MKKHFTRIMAWILILTMTIGSNTMAVFAEELSDGGDSFISEDIFFDEPVESSYVEPEEIVDAVGLHQQVAKPFIGRGEHHPLSVEVSLSPLSVFLLMVAADADLHLASVLIGEVDRGVSRQLLAHTLPPITRDPVSHRFDMLART